MSKDVVPLKVRFRNAEPAVIEVLLEIFDVTVVYEYVHEFSKEISRSITVPASLTQFYIEGGKTYLYIDVDV